LIWAKIGTVNVVTQTFEFHKMCRIYSSAEELLGFQ
jgi:hypothetical protein